mmetsp:Transcript_80769/g.216572  ORF Transcript_80769/g.216572 Transcript_80769/m.216572 type:complete len:124 (+) Transcript_80769:504-875(+)
MPCQIEISLRTLCEKRIRSVRSSVGEEHEDYQVLSFSLNVAMPEKGQINDVWMAGSMNNQSSLVDAGGNEKLASHLASSCMESFGPRLRVVYGLERPVLEAAQRVIWPIASSRAGKSDCATIQ